MSARDSTGTETEVGTASVAPFVASSATNVTPQRVHFGRVAPTRAWALIAAIGWLVFAMIGVAKGYTQKTFDFAVFHTAGARFIEGSELYRDADGDMPFKYPPFIAPALAAFGALPRPFSGALWNLASLVALAWAARFGLDRIRARRGQGASALTDASAIAEASASTDASARADASSGADDSRPTEAPLRADASLRSDVSHRDASLGDASHRDASRADASLGDASHRDAPRADPSLGDASHRDAPRADPSRTDVSRADASRADASQADASQADASQADASRADASRADASRADASRADASRADASRADASRADASRGDASRADAPRGDASRADASRGDASRADAPRGDASRADSPRADSPRAGASRAGASRAGASRADASRADASRADASRADASPRAVRDRSEGRQQIAADHAFVAPFAWDSAAAVWAGAILLHPLFFELSRGQADLFVLGASVGAILFAERRPFLAGALAFVAAALKLPALLLVLYFVRFRRWKVLAAMVAAALVLEAILVARYGLTGAVALHQTWRHVLTGTTPDRVMTTQGWTTLVLGATGLDPSKGMFAVQAVGALSIAAVLLWRRAGAETWFAVLAVATAGLSPLCWNPNYLVAWPALVLAFHRAHRASPLQRRVVVGIGIASAVLLCTLTPGILSMDTYQHLLGLLRPYAWLSLALTAYLIATTKAEPGNVPQRAA